MLVLHIVFSHVNFQSLHYNVMICCHCNHEIKNLRAKICLYDTVVFAVFYVRSLIVTSLFKTTVFLRKYRAVQKSGPLCILPSFLDHPVVLYACVHL